MREKHFESKINLEMLASFPGLEMRARGLGILADLSLSATDTILSPAHPTQSPLHNFIWTILFLYLCILPESLHRVTISSNSASLIPLGLGAQLVHA